MKKQSMKKILIFFLSVLLIFVFCSSAFAAPRAARPHKTVKILLIGNSLTNSNGGLLPYYLEQLSSAAGIKVQVSYFAYNGEVLETYADPHNYRGMEVRAKIRSKKWDYVILQQHTKRTVACPGSTKAAVKKLKHYIKKYSPKAQVLLRCTWAFANSKYIRGRWYSYTSQRKNMVRNSAKIGKKLGLEVIYSGQAFHRYRRLYNHVSLYQWDKNHATPAGYYLDACCVFAKIFDRSPYKLKYYGGMNKNTALQLQKCAAAKN